jgi:predicted GNAT family N-acyltransferase
MIIRVIPDSEKLQLYELRNKVLRLPLGLNLYDEDLSAEQDQIAFGAFDNDILIGCLMLVLKQDNKEAKLRQMAVDSTFQGLGIGKKLVLAAHDYLISQQCEKVVLHAREEAVDFYVKLGYQIFGAPFTEVGIPHVAMSINL